MENNINQIYEENLIYEPVKDNSNFEENNFFENLKEKVLNMDNIASNNIVNDFVNTLVEGITQSNNGDYSNERAVSNSVETSKVDTSRDTNDSSNLITSLNDNKGYEDNNLIYVDENVVIDKPLTRPTRTNTITRTTTRYVNPTNVNGNNNNSNNNYNNNYNNNSNNNNNSNTNRNNNNNQNQNVNTNRNISNRPNKGNLNRGNQNTANRNIPSQGATIQGAVNVNQGTSNRGITNQGTTNQNIPNQVINQGSNGSIPTTNQNQGLNTIPVVNGNEQMSNDNAIPDIVPNGSSYGYASTNNNISDDIQKVQDNATPENKNSNGGSNFTFVIVLVTIPILIILIIASVFFLKKYKKGKRGSNIVYPDDKIRKSNLFGTLQFWNSNKINRVSVSTGSRGSRTNLTSISNDREESNNSNVPEYSEWLEAGSNTLSMPPVSPPPLVTDGKVNGLTSSNFAMGVNINDNMNRNSSIGNSQINKPPMAKNAWKLEGMRIGRERESQRKSTRQSLFNSFQVW